jgi:hypothetical protein
MKIYLVKTSSKEYTFDNLKLARKFIRSAINVNAIKGEKEKYEIILVKTTRKTIDSIESQPELFMKGLSA